MTEMLEGMGGTLWLVEAVFKLYVLRVRVFVDIVGKEAR